MDSDILNLLLLPLLGGYVFCSRCHWTSFAARRADGQRLIYSSSVAGVLLLISARALELTVQEIELTPAFAEAASIWTLLLVVWTAMAAGLLLFGFGFVPQFPKHSREPSIGSGLALLAAGIIAAFVLFDFTLLGFLQGAAGLAITMAAMVHLVRIVIRGATFSVDMTILLRATLLGPSLAIAGAMVVHFGPAIASVWPEFSSIKYSGLALLAATLGATLWMPVNALFSSTWAWKRAHEAGYTSGLERLLYRAFRERLPIQITLKDGKVYSGFILEIPIPVAKLEGSCIEFLPMSSGYRDPVTKAVTITTDYAKIIARLTDPGAQDATQMGPPNPKKMIAIKEQLSSLLKAVPQSEVQVASMFDTSYSVGDFSVSPATDLPFVQPPESKQPITLPPGNAGAAG